MSRGLGPVQRRVLAILLQGVDGEWATFERSYLKELVDGDRSNVRRAIRSLLERGLVEEYIEDGVTWYFPSFLASWYYLPPDIETAPRTHPFTQLLLNKHFGMTDFGKGTLSLNRGTPMEQPPLADARVRAREEKRRQRRERRQMETCRWIVENCSAALDEVFEDDLEFSPEPNARDLV